MRKTGIILKIFGWLVGIAFVGIPVAYIVDARLIHGESLDWTRLGIMFGIGFIFGVIPNIIGDNLIQKAKKGSQKQPE